MKITLIRRDLWTADQLERVERATNEDSTRTPVFLGSLDVGSLVAVFVGAGELIGEVRFTRPVAAETVAILGLALGVGRYKGEIRAVVIGAKTAAVPSQHLDWIQTREAAA